MPATLSPATSPSVTVTLEELCRAFDRIGVPASVSPAGLYHAILQVQGKPSPPLPPSTVARRKALLQLAKETPKDHGFPRPSTMFDPGPEFYSPARRERRQKLLELAKASFPDGVPSPYVVHPSRSGGNLPFVCATISVTNDYDKSQRFRDVWCLWDTAAAISHILTGILNEEVRGSSTEGYVSGEITFPGIPRTFQTSFVYKERLPNDTDFIILGRKHLIECLEVTTTEGEPLASEGHYGSLALVRYRDPLEKRIIQADGVMQHSASLDILCQSPSSSGNTTERERGIPRHTETQQNTTIRQ